MSEERGPWENEPDWLEAVERGAGEDRTSEGAAPGGERAAGAVYVVSGAGRKDVPEDGPGADGEADAGPTDGEGGIESRDEAEPEGGGGPPPNGDMADAGPAVKAEPDAGGDLGRLNENLEQVLEEMDGLLQELAKTGSRLDSLKGEEAKRADAGDAGAAAEPAPAENGGPDADAAPSADAAPDADGETVEMADFYRWIETDRRRRRRWSLAAVAAAAPAALLLGLLVQQQFQVIPLHDPTGGWRGHVWERYGRAIVDCAVEARRTKGEVDCPLVVRRP